MPKFSVGDKVERADNDFSYGPYEITYVGTQGYLIQDREGDEGYENFAYLESYRYQLAKPPVPVKGETWAWNDRNGNMGLGPVIVRISEDDIVVYSYLEATTPYAIPVKAFIENFDKVSE